MTRGLSGKEKGAAGRLRVALTGRLRKFKAD